MIKHTGDDSSLKEFEEWAKFYEELFLMKGVRKSQRLKYQIRMLEYKIAIATIKLNELKGE